MSTPKFNAIVMEKCGDKYFLKVRVLPTETALKSAGISLENTPTQEFTDTFFDDNENSLGKKNCYLRRRAGMNPEIVSEVFQTAESLEEFPQVLVYKERDAKEQEFAEYKEDIVQYTFKRRHSPNNCEIYVDEIKISDKPQDEDFIFRVMSIRRRTSPDSFIPDLKSILVDDLGVQQEDVQDVSGIQKVLSSSDRFLPVRTKFMTMLLLSPKFMTYYSVYKQFDCVKEPMDHVRTLFPNQLTQKKLFMDYYWSVIDCAPTYETAFSLRPDDMHCKQIVSHHYKMDVYDNWQIVLDDEDFPF